MVRNQQLSLRALVCAALLTCVAAPVVAQTTSGQPEDAPTEVGPGSISDFSLDGTVTRRADPPPAAAQAEPEPAESQPVRQQQSQPSEQPSRPAPVASPPATTNDQAEAPAPTPSLSTPIVPRGQPNAADQQAETQPPARAPTVLPPAPESGFNPLPWVAAFLLLGGIAAIVWFMRQSRETAHAGPPTIDIAARAADRRHNMELAQPPASPRAAAPPAQPTADPVPPTAPPKEEPPKNIGVVSTNLRPQIDIVLFPRQADFDTYGATLVVDIALFNAGTAVARDITVDSALINAGERQDAALARLFGRNRPQGDPIPAIDPQQKVEFRTFVKLKREHIEEYKAEGRRLFTPMVGVVAHYKWGREKEALSGAGFLVGQIKQGDERLVPFRTDKGNQIWKNLGARRYEKGLRT